MFTAEDKLAMLEVLKTLDISDPIKLEQLEAIRDLAEQAIDNATKLQSLSDFVSALNASLRVDLGNILANQTTILANQAAMQADINKIKIATKA